MPSLNEIIRYSQQPSPLIQGLSSLVPAAQAIGQANRRNNANEAYQRLSLAFSDETSDPAEVDRLIAEARELDPELTFKIQQMVRESPQRPQQKTAQQKNFEQYQSLKKTDPEAANQFGRSAGFVTPEGKELSSHLQKRLSLATDSSIDARSTASELRGLATDFETADIGGGLFSGKWSEQLKDVTGQQDAVTSLRKRYNSIRGSQVVKNLPPGAASDTDIQLALSGFPSDNATGEQIASFLRGVAKLEDRSADFNEFKAEYISNNNSEKGLLSAYKKSQSSTSEAPAAEKASIVIENHPVYGNVTEADILKTMKSHNLTREQVLGRLGGA